MAYEMSWCGPATAAIIDQPVAHGAHRAAIQMMDANAHAASVTSN